MSERKTKKTETMPTEHPARIPLEPVAEVTFQITDPFPHDFFPNVTRDPVSGGLFVALDRPFPAGTRLNLSFDTGTRRINSLAEVCWGHKVHNGSTPETTVRLIDIAPEDRDLLDFHIRWKK